MTSRKLIICLLASMVMRNPFKDAAYFFLDVLCVSRCGVSDSLSNVSVKSSFILRSWSWERRKLPTSSYVSAPS